MAEIMPGSSFKPNSPRELKSGTGDIFPVIPPDPPHYHSSLTGAGPAWSQPSGYLPRPAWSDHPTVHWSQVLSTNNTFVQIFRAQDPQVGL